MLTESVCCNAVGCTAVREGDASLLWTVGVEAVESLELFTGSFSVLNFLRKRRNTLGGFSDMAIHEMTELGSTKLEYNKRDCGCWRGKVALEPTASRIDVGFAPSQGN